MTTSAPLTQAATGSTICPGCNRRFARTPDLSVIEVEGWEENRGRVDSVGQVHRGIGTHTVSRRWHATCLEEFEESNAAYRAQVEADREAMARSIAEAAGIDFDAWKAGQ